MNASNDGAAAGDSLLSECQGPVAFIWLNRPAVRNALDGPLIEATTAAFRVHGEDPAVRLIVLGGRGAAFCAGADLAWMGRQGELSLEDNRADALRLAELFHAIHTCPKPTVARVHGACFGGGLGLVAACDIAIASARAQFSLSEARIGLLPATISPYVVRAIGARAASRYMLTAEVFDGAQAARLGLVHEAAAEGALDAALERLLADLLTCGPGAQAAIKRLIADVAGRAIDEHLLRDTAQRIADARASAEGREGLSAIHGKRPPAWVVRRDPAAPGKPRP